MFGRLAAEVENLQVPADGAALVELLAIRDRFDAVLSEAVGDFDAAGLWDLDAATSMHAWLRDHADMTGAAAGRTLSTARRLRELPLVAEAWRAGVLSGGQVQAIVANIGPHADLFDQPTMIDALRDLPAADAVLAMQQWRRNADDANPVPDGEPVEPPSRLHLSAGLDGRGFLDGELDVDAHQRLKVALRLADPKDGDGTPAERRAEAHDTIVSFFLDNQQAAPGGRHRPHLNVVIDLESMTGRYVDGTAMARQVLDEYFCDSAWHRVLVAGRSTILDMGVTTRVITAALHVALVARDGHCRFPGCDRPPHWCDGHHVTWFSKHGPTRLDNLVLLCRRHHKRLHQPGWHAKLLPDATFEVTDPNGRVRTSHPPGALPFARAG